MFRCVLLTLLFSIPVSAQVNYEIQVYGSETVLPHATMVELHSNYTIDGSENNSNGVLPTQSALHETIEITHGFNSVFEIGFYIFTSARSGEGWNWVGDHIRPRIRAPEEWHLPFGASFSAEIGYQRSNYSADDWTAELRPIIDKQAGRWYMSFNPTVDFALHGADANQGLEFSPNVKIGFDINETINAGLEYYGSLGPIGNFDPVHDQQHQIFPSIDLNLSPEWEFNAGIGVGLTPATDHHIAKVIVGRRFGI